MKTCSKCGVEQDETKFVRSDRYRDGLYPSCKSCRKKVQLAILDKNPICVRCGVKPHLPYAQYCEDCHRLNRGRPVPTKIVDRNNHTMCSKCKVKPRLSYHNYCQECKNSATVASVQNRGGWWDTLSPEDKKKHTARRAVNHRLKRGTMDKKPCQVCGNPDSVMHHHKGYDGENAFDVQWLCTTHHREAHKKLLDESNTKA